MATVDLHMLSGNAPIDYSAAGRLDFAGPHSRSASAASSSSSHSLSRPHSSHGIGALRGSMGPSPEDLYRASLQLGAGAPPDHIRNSSGQSHSSAYSLASTDVLHTPAESPPNHNLANPALKGVLRPSHIRARAAASPYHRGDADSVYSSASESEDVGVYFGGGAASPEQYHHSLYAQPMGAPSQDAMHAAGAFGRMTLGPDHALEKLAANVRAATTTSAADRAKQIFVQAWLTANYTQYPDGNVPRQGLYFSYRRICDQYNIPHINTATLGKAIRLCFPSIKTRRLGVRGNSKYHYCGIRPATSAEAEFLQDYIRKSNNSAAQNSVNAARAANAKGGDSDEEDDGDESEAGGNPVPSHPPSKRNSLVLKDGPAFASVHDISAEKTPTAASLLSHAQAQGPPPHHGHPRPGFGPGYAPIRRRDTGDVGVLGGPQGGFVQQQQQQQQPQPGQTTVISVRQIPHFPSIEEAVGASSTSPHGVAARELWTWFQDHLDTLLDSIRHFRFDQFEMAIRTFWATLVGNHREVAHAPAIAGLMAKADAIVYDEILEILRSQMLSHIPAASLQALRQLAIKMEQVLLAALDQYGNTFVEPKVELGARFGHLVLRFLDIYQVTQALNTVLTNQKQVAEMRRSWAKINFDSVRNQSALVCNCRHEDLVQLLEVEFVQLLDSVPKTAEPVQAVMSWADKCCERLMGGGRATAGGDERSSMSSRSILIRWGYVTSQVMRDLTIRSDPAFGAFQILKLFLDDWIAMNVLRSVALSTNSVAASVEPVIQQQFFTLSPMPGQESFGPALDASVSRPANGMLHTPTTTSMLAALQQADPFPVDSFTADFGMGAFMDPSSGGGSADDQASGLSFPDFTNPSGAFDVSSAFTPADLSLPSSSATPAASGSPDEHSDAH